MKAVSFSEVSKVHIIIVRGIHKYGNGLSIINPPFNFGIGTDQAVVFSIHEFS